jgi:glycerol transport system substrate-binding protein
VPASVYAVQKYVDWLKAYVPPAAAGVVFGQASLVPAQD